MIATEIENLSAIPAGFSNGAIAFAKLFKHFDFPRKAECGEVNTTLTLALQYVFKLLLQSGFLSM